MRQLDAPSDIIEIPLAQLQLEIALSHLQDITLMKKDLHLTLITNVLLDITVWQELSVLMVFLVLEALIKMLKDNQLQLVFLAQLASSANLPQLNQFLVLKDITAQLLLKLLLLAQQEHLEMPLNWGQILNAQIVKWECSVVRLDLDRLKVFATQDISVFLKLQFQTQLMEQQVMSAQQEDSVN